jgi:tetratricopeptide (TPR) repeat protein
MRGQNSGKMIIKAVQLSGFFLAAGLFVGCNNTAAPKSPKEAIQKYEADYRAAIELHQKLIREGRDVDALRFELGMLYFGKAEFKLALEEFKSSNNVGAAKMSAIAYYNLGDYVEALKILDEQNNLDDQARYYYGLTCEKLNLFDKALQSYRKIKSADFSALAAVRQELIEKTGAGKHIQELDPEISRIISAAPSADKYPQAGAQILLCDEKVQVTPDNKEISSLHYLVKILNERGKEGFSETQIGYDSTYEKVELEFARTIKPDGTVVDVGSRHLRDVSKYMNFPLYSNARVFIISFPEIAEGSVVEYKVKVMRNQLVNKKDFVMDYPVQSSEPIILAKFALEVPKDKVLSIKTLNDSYNYFGANLKPKLEQSPDKTVYLWTFNEIPQIVPENGMPPAVDINPTIIISTFQSWQDVYSWWWGLAKDKMVCDGPIKAKIQELTATAKSDEEKLRAISNFCAKDIRYVAVEYGQAGYEPHAAADIFKNKYGDCKDQAVLLVAMLTSAGFQARPVLIGTRDAYNLDENFPNMLFNHAIAAVSFENKTIFLDPTAETCSFGDLPAGDQERKVLMCSQDGYKIETTPLYPAEHNLVRQVADIKIDEDESIIAEKAVYSFGVYDQSQRYWLLYTMPEVVREQIAEKAQDVSIGAKLESYKVKNLNDLNKPVELSYKFRGPEYLVPGGALRIMPQVGNLDTGLVAKDVRRYPIDFNFLDIKELELNLLLPANFMIKYIPEKISKDSPWMKFEASYRSEGRKLVFKQKLELKKNKILESEYPAFKYFFESLAKSLKQRAVLERRK